MSFNKDEGNLCQWKYNNQDLLKESPRLNFWRAPIDNDLLGNQEFDAEEVSKDWAKYNVSLLKENVRSLTYESNETGVMVIIKSHISPTSQDWGFKTQTVYQVTNDGRIILSTKGIKFGSGPQTLPKIGFQMGLPKEFQQVKWFGRGPGESYSDSKEATRFDIWSNMVPELSTPYIFPQENGNRLDTRWVKLYNKHGVGICVTGSDFNFSARNERTASLEQAKHQEELVEAPVVELNLDYQQHGLGTASCGPAVLDQYRLLNDNYEFSLTLEPYLASEASLIS